MLGILALIAVFISAYYAYKTANGTGRSGPLWALATLGVGLGCQIVLPVLVGLILGIVYVVTGTPVSDLQQKIAGITMIISFVALFLSFVGIWLVLRHISKIPEDRPGTPIPPPPPTFGGGE